MTTITAESIAHEIVAYARLAAETMLIEDRHDQAIADLLGKVLAVPQGERVYVVLPASVSTRKADLYGSGVLTQAIDGATDLILHGSGHIEIHNGYCATFTF